MYVLIGCKIKIAIVPRMEGLEWRVDYLMASSSQQELNTPSVQLKVHYTDGNKKQIQAFDLSADKFRVLLNGMIWSVSLTYYRIESS